jgi:uncharacterized membrane protein HdeD (DUF308 family)
MQPSGTVTFVFTDVEGSTRLLGRWTSSSRISTRHEIEVWWLQLIGGIIELALGFWAAGYYGRSAVLLVAWVAAFAIIRGVRDIVLAFRVREVQHAAAS